MGKTFRNDDKNFEDFQWAKRRDRKLRKQRSLASEIFIAEIGEFEPTIIVRRTNKRRQLNSIRTLE